MPWKRWMVVIVIAGATAAALLFLALVISLWSRGFQECNFVGSDCRKTGWQSEAGWVVEAAAFALAYLVAPLVLVAGPVLYRRRWRRLDDSN